jgi:hypothetical protein
MKQKVFPFLIALSALAVSASAAFYSITGLSKLFAGASTEVIIMASSLEAAKLVMASLLYQYWDKLGKLLRTYLTIALLVLIGITSAGIYGFLSAAYQETASKASVVDKETQVYKVKKERFEQSKTDYTTEKQRLDNDISQLRGALATGSTTQSVDVKTGQIVTRANNANRKTFEAQLNSAIQNKQIVDDKIVAANDSITALDMKILEIESKAELAGELGPLKYISKLTGKPMDQIINWFLLVIIFVFDPLAICLVIAANIAFSQLKPKITPEVSPKEYQIYNPSSSTVEESKSEIPVEQPTQVSSSNTQEQINNIMSQPISSWKKSKLIDDIKQQQKDDDDIIKYT